MSCNWQLATDWGRLLQMHKTYLIKTAKGAANFREAASLLTAALPSASLPVPLLSAASCCINELHTRCTWKSKFFNRHQCQLQRERARDTNCTTGDNHQVIGLSVSPLSRSLSVSACLSLSLCHTVHARHMRSTFDTQLTLHSMCQLHIMKMCCN